MPKFEVFTFKLNEKFVKEIRNDEENINSEISKEFFEYHNPSFLVKHLLKLYQVQIIK